MAVSCLRGLRLSEPDPQTRGFPMAQVSPVRRRTIEHMPQTCRRRCGASQDAQGSSRRRYVLTSELVATPLRASQ